MTICVFQFRFSISSCIVCNLVAVATVARCVGTTWPSRGHWSFYCLDIKFLPCPSCPLSASISGSVPPSDNPLKSNQMRGKGAENGQLKAEETDEWTLEVVRLLSGEWLEWN